MDENRYFLKRRKTLNTVIDVNKCLKKIKFFFERERESKREDREREKREERKNGKETQGKDRAYGWFWIVSKKIYILEKMSVYKIFTTVSFQPVQK